MSATLKMKKWRDNFLQIPEGLRGHPMSELEEVASTLTAIVNMTDDSHIQDMAKFCITEVIAADKEIAKRKDMYHECRVLRVKDKKVHLQEIATRDAELARLREALSDAKRSLTRGIIIPKDIADSIDEALKSNDS